MKTKETKAIAVALVGNSIFGFSFMASKIALQAAEPMVLLGFRFLTAFLVMNLILLTGKEKLHLKGKPVGMLLLLGLFQPILYFIFESYGIEWTTSGFSGAMIAMIPVAKFTAFANVTTVISIFAGVLFLGEPFGWVSLAGAVMIIIGVYGVNREQQA